MGSVDFDIYWIQKYRQVKYRE